MTTKQIHFFTPFRSLFVKNFLNVDILIDEVQIAKKLLFIRIA